ncbi:MAG TPA: hypothetical protein VIC30_12640 [Orrella sp.]
MRTIYELDGNRIYTGQSRQITDKDGRPPRWIETNLTPPDGIAQWRGNEWAVLPEYPVAPVSVPQSITMRQCRLQLLAIGKLADVDTAIAGMPDPAKSAAQIEWEYAATVERNAPLIAQLGPALGLDGAALDDLFIAAATL